MALPRMNCSIPLPSGVSGSLSKRRHETSGCLKVLLKDIVVTEKSGSFYKLSAEGQPKALCSAHFQTRSDHKDRVRSDLEAILLRRGPRCFHDVELRP